MADLSYKKQEPFLERYSDVFGNVKVYSPLSDIVEWKKDPWLITLDRDDSDSTKPGRYMIKPDKVMDAFQSPGLIRSHKYEYEEDQD